jgi:hypothetical protein
LVVQANFIKIENVKVFGKMVYVHMGLDVSLDMDKMIGHLIHVWLV